MNLRERMLDVFDETILWYRTNPRGIDLGLEGEQIGCSYLMDDGSMCAVGRCCDDPQLGWDCTVYGLTLEPGGNNLDSLLKPEYQGLPLKFWDLLQALHDDMECWKKNDLGGWDLTGLGQKTLAIRRDEVLSGELE